MLSQALQVKLLPPTHPRTPLEKASSVPTGASLSRPETTAIPLAADEASTVPLSTLASSWRSVAACAGLDRRARNRLISASQSGGKESSSSSRARRGEGRRRSRWGRPESSTMRRRALPPPLSGVATASPCFAGAAAGRREHAVEVCITETKTEAEAETDIGRRFSPALRPCFARNASERSKRAKSAALFRFIRCHFEFSLAAAVARRRRNPPFSLFDSQLLSLSPFFFCNSRAFTRNAAHTRSLNRLSVFPSHSRPFAHSQRTSRKNLDGRSGEATRLRRGLPAPGRRRRPVARHGWARRRQEGPRGAQRRELQAVRLGENEGERMDSMEKEREKKRNAHC